MYGIKHEFDAIGNTQLVEYAKEIFFYGMLAQPEFTGNVTVAQSVGNQGNYLLFAVGKEVMATDAGKSHCGDLGDRFEQIVQLLSTGGNLTGVHPADALAQERE